MTITGFLARLKKTPRRGWRLTRERQIRFGKLRRCPLTQVAGVSGYRDAAHALGLTIVARDKIVCAADNVKHCVALRRRLLQATGLARIAPRRRSR